MTRTVIVGGSLTGLATALALGERGHRVTVLERSAPPPEGPPGKAADGWERPLVPQSQQSHTLTSLGVKVLAERAPAILADALAEGARMHAVGDAAPPSLSRSPEAANDPELRALAVRRATLELLLHAAVRTMPGVSLRHGTTVRGLVVAPAGRAVAGVLTDRGERIPAETVVDATGRRAEHRRWLEAAGLPSATDLTGPTALRVFSRFYRLRDATAPAPGPLNRGNAAGGIWDHYAAVLHPAEDGVFALSFGVLPGDPATTALRDAGAFTAAARLSPYVAPWLEPGASEPLAPVRVMTVPPNLLRGTVTARQRPVHGLFPVGDAACVTDPIFGRGMSLAFAHAFRLADLLDAEPRPGDAQSAGAVGLVDELLRPWFVHDSGEGVVRRVRWRAATRGAEAPAPTPVPLAAPAGRGRPALSEVAAAATTDGLVWRGLHRVLMSLDPPGTVFDDPVFRERVRTAPPARPTPGVRPPSRAELLEALNAGKGA
ncbi:FAD-dependent oxidoreductase [Streptomyces sp. CB02414]|uniref:FAD-dependent oxidoreductase n=1 Tax=Streptomyces sp. CB02414 TaxID=1703922 RepID=UPI00093FE14D|nr:FAD-dependent oxidoreductase [Streptomyces sp. CB02414]OKI81359.1 hypothetical protein AMK11_25675 [Streptomyces sp. CB02414]